MRTLPNDKPFLPNHTTFALVFTALYGVALAFFMQYHELWFDETEPWLLALYSNSYTDLLTNKQFEGHPNLWYSLLYVITRFTDNLQALKITQWACALGFVFVFLRNAPFPRVTKLLICFGYYGLFEYGLISRLYAIELLTLFLICTFYPKRFTHWYGYVLLLILNAQTNLFGFLMSGVLGLLLLSEAFKIWKESPHWAPISTSQKIMGGFLWALGCGFSFWSMLRPVEPHKEFFPLTMPYYFFQSGTRLWQAFVPIPSFIVNFWNTSLLNNSKEIVLSGVLFLVIAGGLLGVKRLLYLFLLLFATLFFFFYLKFEGSLRHHAHYFIFTLAFYWIASFYQKEEHSSYPLLLQRFHLWTKKWFAKLLLVCAVLQVAAGVYALYIEVKYPFFPGKQVAEYLKTLPSHAIIVTEDEVTSSNITAYYGQPIFHLPNGNYRSFYVLNFLEDHNPRKFVLLDWAGAIAQQRQAPVIYISRNEIPYQWHTTPVILLKEYKGNYINTFSFFIYEIPPLPIPKKQITAEPPVGGL
ncbi:hypothetical protein GU926_17005 [Nibribacter ruber]|uniref:Glycosyltransferase RgtA/B/C/D-like domain-containing protein n=1 Tax=Nibribacter ruber TaxID=2698458 RepID=A0A6P1P3R1_9BACT|nr:hypothetical protein [Nibribacter ruber]QHL89032.1 hypothetical protein GU926_17005 [Nibribacter ruber]